MHVCLSCAFLVLQNAEEITGSPGAGITDSYKPSCGSSGGAASDLNCSNSRWTVLSEAVPPTL